MWTETRLALTACLAFVLASGPAVGQPPADGPKERKPKEPPDEFKALVNEVREAYKAPLEVDEDIRDELRKQYKNPMPGREEKIFKEIRRLYQTTPEQEQAILREVRLAYQQQTPAQEERLLSVIRQSGKLPLGTVPAGLQAEQGAKLFRKFDRNGDGLLNPAEMPDTLRVQFVRWDRNRDGSLDTDEYVPYFQASLQIVSTKVAAGEIEIKLPKGVTVQSLAAAAKGGEPATAARPARPAVGLPGWFAEFDTDRDGQVGLYEWRKHGRPTAEFVTMDRNEDGLLEAKELLAYLADHPQPQPPAAKKGGRAGPPKGP